MTQARLIICPKTSTDAPAELPEIIKALKDIGLIAEEFSNNDFYAGDSFINLISFLGCSPNIQLSPEDGDQFCFIHISETTTDSQHLGHCRSVSAKCPNCKTKIKDWKSANNWQSGNSQYSCQQCDTQSILADLKWCHEAGYGRLSISIVNIHPHEAVPAEKVLQTLNNVCGFEWTYFYANNEIQS